MPPRIQNQISTSLLPYITSPSASSSSSLPASSLTKLTSCTSPSRPPTRRTTTPSRPFSTTLPTHTRQRSQMFEWLNGEGTPLKSYTPGTPNYMGSLRDRSAGTPEAQIPNFVMRRPFPLNSNFISENILSEELRSEIHTRVSVKKQSVRAVSVDLGVDMRRVAAVVRLVEMEKRWAAQNKPLAHPYARAIHEMVPTTPLHEDPRDNRRNPHEPINDLPVHRLTDPQIFYPVSESRQFTRSDAGRIFSAAPALPHEDVRATVANPTDTITAITQKNRSAIETVGKNTHEHQVLQPADARIPHPHLIAHERDRLANPQSPREVWTRYSERLAAEEQTEKERKQAAKEWKEARMERVIPEDSRFEFRVRNAVVSKQTTAVDGRGASAPGRRYGVPNYDRKKGQAKIPTRVEV